MFSPEESIFFIYTEQVPEKLGQTIPVVAEFLKKIDPIPKASFSCLMEARICVYQTVVDLISQKYKVQVVCDAVRGE